MSIYVIGRGNKRPGKVIDTTSRGEWRYLLSPFYLKIPYQTPSGECRASVENLWQYSKCYSKIHTDKRGLGGHISKHGEPTDAWLEWFYRGIQQDKAIRYPLGKNIKPEFSVDIFNLKKREKLDYIAARKRVYCKLYLDSVDPFGIFQTKMFELAQETDVLLWDFDSYDIGEVNLESLKTALNYPVKKFGHSFLVASKLLGYDYRTLTAD